MKDMDDTRKESQEQISKDYSKLLMSSVPALPVHRLTRSSRVSSTVIVKCDDIPQYFFAPDKSKEFRIWMYAGASRSTNAIAYLTFPKTHNAFRMHLCVSDGSKTTNGDNNMGIAHESGDDDRVMESSMDIIAGIGHPHPKSFSFRLPVRLGRGEFVWTHQGGDIDHHPPAQYALHDQSLPRTHLATLIVKKSNKEGTSIHWKIGAEDELQRTLILCSAIGIITRLSRKGKLHDGSSTLRRWNNFWWLAALSTAAIA